MSPYANACPGVHGGVAGNLPGLKRMRAATPPGLCPFCLDPIPEHPGVGRKPTHCGAVECRAAYFRCDRRDRRAAARPRVHHIVKLSDAEKRLRRKARQPELSRRIAAGHARRNAP